MQHCVQLLVAQFVLCVEAHLELVAGEHGCWNLNICKSITDQFKAFRRVGAKGGELRRLPSTRNAEQCADIGPMQLDDAELA